MKLLLVSRSTPLHPGAGGMERVFWDLAKALGKSMTVEVLTTSVPGQLGTFVHEGVTVTALPNTTPGRYSSVWWLKTSLFSRAKEFDAVVSVSGGATGMIHVQRGPRYIFQAHGTALAEMRNALRVRPRLWPLKALRYSYWTILDFLTYCQVDRVIAASEQVAKSLRSWPYSKAWTVTSLEVIKNAVDTSLLTHSNDRRKEVRRRLSLLPQDIVAVTVRGQGSNNGIHYVVDAVLRGQDEVKLLVGGADCEGQNIKSAHNDRVLLLGDLDREGLRDALAAADVFVLPTGEQTQGLLPLSVLEALAAGLRVIVPKGSVWPSSLVPLLQFADVEDLEALSHSIAKAGDSKCLEDGILDDAYSLSAWASK